MGLFTGVKCDMCGDRVMFEGCIPKVRIQRWIRQEGWTVGKKTLCSKCKKTGKAKV